MISCTYDPAFCGVFFCTFANSNYFVNALAKNDKLLAPLDKLSKQKYLIMFITKTDDGHIAQVSTLLRREGA